MKNKQLLWVAAAGLVAGAAIILPVFAQAQTIGAAVGVNASGVVNPGGPMQPVTAAIGSGAVVSTAVPAKTGQMWANPRFGGGPGPVMLDSGVFGKVTSVNGTTLTVVSMNRMHVGPPNTAVPTVTSTAASTTVYTVNASDATVTKNGASSTISNVLTGDTVFVKGTINGTNVTASAIIDGVTVGRMPMGRGNWKTSSTVSTALPIKGNGEPVIAGNISAISGTTLTVTNSSNVTYTVDASSAAIVKNGASSSISSVSTGDQVVVQGTVEGTSITASSVIDQGTGKAPSGTGSVGASAGVHLNIFGQIGSFFKRLFGF